MLHYATIYPETLELLKELQRIDFIRNYALVGGTSLALQIGHRISVDLDLFAHTDADAATLLEYIAPLGKITVANQSPRVLNLFINEIKVDFVNYRYPFIKPIVKIDELRLASPEDIAAMKLAAITGRGSKKDFVDLYFLLKHYSFPKLFEFYRAKFSDGNDFLVFKSLTYFEDAELEPMPKILVPTDWEEVKSTIIKQVKVYFP